MTIRQNENNSKLSRQQYLLLAIRCALIGNEKDKFEELVAEYRALK